VQTLVMTAPADAGAPQDSRMFSAADAYERYMGRWSRLLAPKLVAFAGVREGERVLDVGTGTGALARAIETAMPSTEVVGIDPSEGFVARARQTAVRALFEAGDAQSLRFDDASFDRVLSLVVINFVPDHEKAVAEMRRVTRPGGTVGACVWDYGEGMQMLRFFWDEAVALNPGAEAKDERHMKLCRAGQLGELWSKAGLANVRERAVAIEQAYASFEDYWVPFTMGAGPGGAYVVSLPEGERRALEARLRKRLLGGRPDRAFKLEAKAWCVRGDVPGT